MCVRIQFEKCGRRARGPHPHSSTSRHPTPKIGGRRLDQGRGERGVWCCDHAAPRGGNGSGRGGGGGGGGIGLPQRAAGGIGFRAMSGTIGRAPALDPSYIPVCHFSIHTPFTSRTATFFQFVGSNRACVAAVVCGVPVFASVTNSDRKPILNCLGARERNPAPTRAPRSGRAFLTLDAHPPICARAWYCERGAVSGRAD